MHWIFIGAMIGVGIMLAPLVLCALLWLAPLVLRALLWLAAAAVVAAIALMLPPGVWAVMREGWDVVWVVLGPVFLFAFAAFACFAVFAIYLRFGTFIAVLAWRFVRKPCVNDPRPIWRPIPYLSLPDFEARAEAKRIAAAAPAPLASPPASRG